MHLVSLATASPRIRYSQEDCYRIFEASNARDRLSNRSATLMEKVLMRDNGIHRRGFCYPDVKTIFDAGPEQLNKVFEQEAPRLGTRALTKALDRAKLDPASLDGLIVCTCTGYLCPGLSSFIAQQAGLPENAELTDLVGMGCGAAIPSLRTACHRLKANPSLRIAVVAVEICSAAFYLDDDPGVIISACLFGDGAAASIWTGTSTDGPGWKAGGFRSLHLPEARQLLRFENAGGALRNRLSKSVPQAAADAVRKLFELSFAEGAVPDNLKILPHPGGRDVLDALEKVFPSASFKESRSVLAEHGNMSSPSILFILDQYLRLGQKSQAAALWVTSFGAGFSAYGFDLVYAQ
ncbi:MAG: type III polyketide synthase [Opitutales bacterium]|jgi:predicted naringenin-chalcone synthase